MTFPTSRLALSRLSIAAGAALVTIAGSPALAQSTSASPTYTRDVTPILQRSCQNCHRPGSIGPMSLLNYEETRPWARSIKNRVSQRQMPPWHVDRNAGTIHKFKDDPSLSDKEIATIVAWVDAGAPRGNPGDLPAAKTFDDSGRWH